MIVFVLPRRFAVAFGAVLPEPSAVLIVRAVAADAVLRRLLDRHVVEVAGAADQFLMTAHERKTRQFFVVEHGSGPFGVVVARPTVATAAAAVHVVGAMTRYARFWQALPHFIDVAGLAADIDVRAAQVERRF